MQYLSAREVAEKWHTSEHWVNELCTSQRIEGATYLGDAWIIPACASRPDNSYGGYQKKVPSLIPGFLLTSSLSFKPGKADETTVSLQDEALCKQFKCELAYLRGDMEEVLNFFFGIDFESSTCLAQAVVSASAAINLGEYRLCEHIGTALARLKKEQDETSWNFSLIELAEATIASSMQIPDACPEWLSKGDFSRLPSPARPFALYICTKYLHGKGDIERMLTIAETTLTLHESKEIPVTDIYLHLACAVANIEMRNKEAAEKHVLHVLHVALPDGFITPLAEHAVILQTVLKKLLTETNPGVYESIFKTWKPCWKNRVIAHNRITHGETTSALTLRQYQVASLAKRGWKNAEIAEQLDISTASVKAYLQTVYEGLLISTRKDLDRFIF